MNVFESIPGHDTIDARREPHPMTEGGQPRRTIMQHVHGDIDTLHAAVNRVRTVTRVIADAPELAALVEAAIDAHRAAVPSHVFETLTDALKAATTKQTGPQVQLNGTWPTGVAREVAAHIAATTGPAAPQEPQNGSGGTPVPGNPPAEPPEAATAVLDAAQPDAGTDTSA